MAGPQWSWGQHELRLGVVTYIIRILCREVLHRWDGALGNELPIRWRCLLLHNLSLHSGEGGKNAGRNEGCSVTGGPATVACPDLDRPLPSTPRTGQLKLYHGFPKSHLRSPPSL